MISIARPLFNDNSTTATRIDEPEAIDMLELVGSERCLEMLNVLNEVFDSFERETADEEVEAWPYPTM